MSYILTKEDIIETLNAPVGSVLDIFTRKLSKESEQIGNRTLLFSEFENTGSLYLKINTHNPIADDLPSMFMGFEYYCYKCKKIIDFQFERAYALKDRNYFVFEFNDIYKDKIVLIVKFTIAKFDGENQFCFVKVGQSPINKVAICKEYRNELTPEQLSDYINAYKSKNEELYVASFVYLRRIFESFIEKVEENTNNERIGDRIKRLANNGQIDSIFKEEGFNTVYSILSKHIHELTEEETKSCVDVLFSAVENIIDSEIAHKKELKEREKLKKQLNKINSV